jgi:hypothetical protein
MRAYKNSSPTRELGLYPKFTTTDSHMSLPRSCSHNGPTNPRNKPQTIPKRKHEARSKGLAVLQEPWRTVRGPGVDGLRSPCGRSLTHGELSIKHEQNDPTGTSTRGRSAKHPPVKSNWRTRSKPKCSRTRDEHEEHLDELLHADSPRAPHGRSARHGNNSPNLKPKPPKLLLVHGSPKRLKLLRKDLGKM